MPLFGQLSDRLSGALGRLSGRGRITEANVEETLREVRVALLEADVALPVVKDFIVAVKARALGAEVAKSLSPGQAFVKIVQDELAAALSSGDSELNLRVRPPAVILLAGLQGSGKTTTAAKLAARLSRTQRKRVLLVSTDVQRPAAMEQLEKLAQTVGVGFIPAAGESPMEIAKRALARARAELTEVLIVDTAGRLHVDAALMDEIRALADLLSPIETLFVADAMTGQDAVRSAAAFGETLPLTGVILTKADGDARGGAALSVARVTGRPIKFIGTGEKTDALESFDPQRMAARILGMGDVVGLVETVTQKTDQKQAEALAGKLRKGKDFDLADFRSQIEQMLNMGGAKALLEHLPGASKLAGAAASVDERALRRQMAIVDSMTPRERRHPALINGSRRRRIAAGSGTEVPDVNRLLRQFQQAQKMMKKFKKGGLQRALGALGGGRFPPGF
ncbi:MAG: signal recognition particle protein [Gammaproteobacteria bacterium]